MSYDTDGFIINKYEETNRKTAGLRIKRIARVGTIDSISHLLNFINTFVIILSELLWRLKATQILEQCLLF